MVLNVLILNKNAFKDTNVMIIIVNRVLGLQRIYCKLLHSSSHGNYSKHNNKFDNIIPVYHTVVQTFLCMTLRLKPLMRLVQSFQTSLVVGLNSSYFSISTRRRFRAKATRVLNIFVMFTLNCYNFKQSAFVRKLTTAFVKKAVNILLYFGSYHSLHWPLDILLSSTVNII